METLVPTTTLAELRATRARHDEAVERLWHLFRRLFEMGWTRTRVDTLQSETGILLVHHYTGQEWELKRFLPRGEFLNSAKFTDRTELPSLAELVSFAQVGAWHRG